LDITKYIGYFHDGYLLDINNLGNSIYLSLESSKIDPNEIENKEILSKSNTLIGKLCLKNVKTIKVDDKPYKDVLLKVYDNGEILDLEVYPGKVSLLIEWVNFPPKPRTSDVSQIEIEAEEIYWENIPTLSLG